MKLLLASSEVHPYSKTGGLADMVGALSKSLAEAGHQVGLVTPLYRGVQERFPDIHRFDWHLDLPLGARRIEGEVWVREWQPNLTVYFIHQQDFYDRGGIYGESGADYTDNAERFIFFSKCVVNLARYLPWRPELVHIHDWEVGLVPLMIRDQARREGWGTAPKVCLTIHNQAYQGVFQPQVYALTNLPAEYFQPGGVEFYGRLNCLKAAILYADVLTTVSPRYAREILTEAFGCGLDGILRQRQNVLHGILNGVDYTEWKTVGNPFLKNDYTFRNLRGKLAQKTDLQRELGLSQRKEVPLFGNITRLVSQKGSDILLGALEEMIPADMQFVLLGGGDPYLEVAFQRLAARHPGKVAVRIGYDHALSHRIEAGCDFFAMPSRFEPCGLNQMYSLRYGTIPIVRVTGGLDDSVIDPSEDAVNATGIKFLEPTPRALARAIRKALVLYPDERSLRALRKNGMTTDFSWKRTTAAYAGVYERALRAGTLL